MPAGGERLPQATQELAFTLPVGYTGGTGRRDRRGTMRLASVADETDALKDFRVFVRPETFLAVILSKVLRLAGLEAPRPDLLATLASEDLHCLETLYRFMNGYSLSLLAGKPDSFREGLLRLVAERHGVEEEVMAPAAPGGEEPLPGRREGPPPQESPAPPPATVSREEASQRQPATRPAEARREAGSPPERARPSERPPAARPGELPREVGASRERARPSERPPAARPGELPREVGASRERARLPEGRYGIPRTEDRREGAASPARARFREGRPGESRRGGAPRDGAAGRESIRAEAGRPGSAQREDLDVSGRPLRPARRRTRDVEFDAREPYSGIRRQLAVEEEWRLRGF